MLINELTVFFIVYNFIKFKFEVEDALTIILSYEIMMYYSTHQQVRLAHFIHFVSDNQMSLSIVYNSMLKF